VGILLDQNSKAMKRIFTIFFLSLLALTSFAQDFGTFKQVRLRNNTDSVSTGATTNGTIRYDATANKFRFRQGGAWTSFEPDGRYWNTSGATTTSSPTITGGGTFGVGKWTFTPDATNPGVNMGSVAGDPSTPANGDFWYNTTNGRPTVKTSSGSGGLLYTTGTITTGQLAFAAQNTTGNQSFDADLSFATATNTLTVGRVVTVPTATLPGLNVGSVAGDPSAPVNGDVWYNTAVGFKFRRGGATENIVSALGLTATRIPISLSTGTLSDDADLTFNTAGNILTVGVGNIYTVTNASVDNMFIGESAGNISVTGSNNHAFGFQSQLSLTSGVGNTTLGGYAGQGITSGSDNTFIGHTAGTGANIGSSNTGLGAASLNLINGSSGNIGVGKMAGDNITTGGNNIVIGTDADAQSATASNQLVIQNIIYGTNNSATGTTASTGEIAIGTPPSTGVKFQVHQSTLGGEVLRLTSVATNDDPLVSVYQQRVATTDATVTTLHSLATTTDYTYVVEVKVIARRTGGASGAAGDSAGYSLLGTFKNVAGTVTQVGTTSVVATHESQAAWDCVFDISTTNIRVRITGAAGNNVTWHSTVELSALGS
jgi:hypothetical protein